MDNQKKIKLAEIIRRYKTAKTAEERFKASVELCKEAGVPDDNYLHNKEEVDNYFLGQ